VITFRLLTPGKVTLLDEEDLPLAAGHRWYWMRVGRDQAIEYAYTHVEKRRLYLHRLLCPDAVEVDHINGDGLDNRRKNLRSTTHKLNLANQRPQQGRSSQYKGVSWERRRGRWEAYIRIDKQHIHLGKFDDEVEAALAYDKAAIAAWGSYARPNLPEV
jgi:hypothetical protein